jgi:hypothetical protein
MIPPKGTWRLWPRGRQGREIESWIDLSTVLDSWVSGRWRRSITLYALVDPLRDQGYVAVSRSGNGLMRTIVFLREGNELRSLDPGAELPVLRRRARVATNGEVTVASPNRSVG